MPEFSYIARSPSGQQSNGTLTANSEREVMTLLDQRGLFPVRIVREKEITGGLSLFSRRVRPRVLAMFFSQLADLLNSGVPLLRCLEILDRQSATPALQFILKEVRADVADGSSLADAMYKHPRAFNTLTVSMIRAGEEGGFLEDVLMRISEFLDHQEELKSKVIGALAYPLFLIFAGGALIVALLIWVIPQFKTMFEQQANMELPFLTQMLLSFTDFLSARPLFLPNYVWIFALLVGLWLLFRMWANSRDGRWLMDGFKLKIPIAGTIWKDFAVARFCRILGTMLRNGIPILAALKISKDSTGNTRLSAAIEKSSENVTAGESLAKPLAACGLFPRDVMEMVAVGEESNNLETVLLNIADSTERRNTRKLELLVRLLEPVLLLLMAAMVLVVVLALLLPFLNIGKTVA